MGILIFSSDWKQVKRKMQNVIFHTGPPLSLVRGLAKRNLENPINR